MTSRPRVSKHGNTWRVTINNRLYASRATHEDAWQFAEKVTTYARRIRFYRDIARTERALERMENR